MLVFKIFLERDILEYCVKIQQTSGHDNYIKNSNYVGT